MQVNIIKKGISKSKINSDKSLMNNDFNSFEWSLR